MAYKVGGYAGVFMMMNIKHPNRKMTGLDILKI